MRDAEVIITILALAVLACTVGWLLANATCTFPVMS